MGGSLFKDQDDSGCYRLCGAPGKGFKPQPISQDEARAILQKAGEIKSDKTLKPKQSRSAVGETIRIIDGPFDTFTGSIEEINLEKGKLEGYGWNFRPCYPC